MKPTYAIKDFLVNQFQSVGEITAQKVLEMAKIDPNKKISSLTDDELSRLTEAMKKFEDFRPPSADALSVIGSDLIELSLKKIFNPEFVGALTRKPKAYQGHPFIVEVGIAYGGQIQPSSEPLVLRYANKIPLIYDEKSDVIWKVVEEVDWKRYGVEGDQIPLVVMVHLCSTKVPYKSAGKESIAEVEEIEKEIKYGIMEVARNLRLFISQKKKEEETKKRMLTYLKYIPEVARSLSVFLADGKKADADKHSQELKTKLFEIVAKKLDLKDLEEYKLYKVEEL